MQTAVELSLHALGDTKSKSGKRQHAASFRSNGRPAPVYAAPAAPAVPYQDPRRAPPAPQHTSLFRSLAAESRASQPSNVTPIGVYALRSLISLTILRAKIAGWSRLAASAVCGTQLVPWKRGPDEANSAAFLSPESWFSEL